MHIGEPFENVSGILAGTPVQVVTAEASKMGNMFGSNINER
jgi:hypothetical protein